MSRFIFLQIAIHSFGRRDIQYHYWIGTIIFPITLLTSFKRVRIHETSVCPKEANYELRVFSLRVLCPALGWTARDLQKPCRGWEGSVQSPTLSPGRVGRCLMFQHIPEHRQYFTCGRIQQRRRIRLNRSRINFLLPDRFPLNTTVQDGVCLEHARNTLIAID